MAEKLLKDVEEVIDSQKDSFKTEKSLRDCFGKKTYELQLGVPSGDSSHRIFRLNYTLGIPIIQAHINDMKSKLVALNELARTEIDQKQAEKSLDKEA